MSGVHSAIRIPHSAIGHVTVQGFSSGLGTVVQRQELPPMSVGAFHATVEKEGKP